MSIGKTIPVTTSKEISEVLDTTVEPSDQELATWEALKCELGDLKHSLLAKGSAAVPHNSSMIHMERQLAESVYRRKDGAMVIVGTPTLAQGLNLPAEMAILAGDKRFDVETR